MRRQERATVLLALIRAIIGGIEPSVVCSAMIRYTDRTVVAEPAIRLRDMTISWTLHVERPREVVAVDFWYMESEWLHLDGPFISSKLSGMTHLIVTDYIIEGA